MPEQQENITTEDTNDDFQWFFEDDDDDDTGETETPNTGETGEPDTAPNTEDATEPDVGDDENTEENKEDTNTQEDVDDAPEESETVEDEDADNDENNEDDEDDEEESSEINKDKIIAKLRSENARRRQQLKQARQQAVDAVEETLVTTLKPLLDYTGVDQLDIDEIPNQLEQLAKENREVKQQLALTRAATRTGADLEALTDSRAFNEKISSLNPNSEHYQRDVLYAVQESMESNPRFKAAAKIPRSGGDDFSGGTPQTLGNSVEDFIQRRRKRTR